MATKLTLVGGKGTSGSAGGGKQSLHDRMSKPDRLLERLYFKLSFTGPFSVQLWAIGKLGALHGKYNYPSEDNYIEIPMYRNDR